MEVKLAITIISSITGILGCIMGVLGFTASRKDKSNKDTEKTSYNQGRLDATLKNIMEKLDKIEDKLNLYDKEFDDKIEKAINNHIKIYHKGA